MVGLVLVSHSRALVDALIALVKQVSPVEIPLAGAGGIGTEHQDFGTDAIDISDAISSVYSETGVLLLMDLGSSVLSAEMAVEFLPADMQRHIRFCAAPLVEGAVAAGVQIGLQADLNAVYQEAQRALFPKVQHFSDAVPASKPSSEIVHTPEGETTEQVILTIQAVHGLHARPAARFVQTAAAFQAIIQVQKLPGASAAETLRSPVSGTSLNSLTTLGVLQGDQILVSAQGCEAVPAVEALQRLVQENFGEDLSGIARESNPAFYIRKAAGGQSGVVPLSEGIAIGPVVYERTARLEAPREKHGSDPEGEWGRLTHARDTVRQMISQRRQQITTTLGNSNAAIFDAHLFILDDQALLNEVRTQIEDQRLNAAAAWYASITSLADTYQALPNPYQQQRANDVLDVGNQVLAALLPEQPAPSLLEMPEPGILVIPELSPSLVAQLDPSRVLGIITRQGGPTDHSVILARALRIPVIAMAAFQEVTPGTMLAIDGGQGTLWVEPNPEKLQELRQRQSTLKVEREQTLSRSHLPATTTDGYRVRIFANAGSVWETQAASRHGAEGIGLLRTEFLFLTHATPPSEEEQVETLLHIGDLMPECPVVVRTLDVGGDKFLPYVTLPPEANPALGIRSIRLSLRHPELFLTQLRAILRAGASHELRIMFPMISQVNELNSVVKLLEHAHHTLEYEQRPHRWPISTAMMIETPSAALLTAAFADAVDYFSIGTNDLTQYTLAAERGNAELSAYADGLHPAVLLLIHQVVQQAHQAGKIVSVCGELASDPVAVPILLGLGVDELSVNPLAVPQIKASIRKMDRSAAVRLAQQVLQQDRTNSVRQLAEAFLLHS